VRIYSATSEETLRTRKFLADWASEDFLSKPQYQLLEREAVSELRTTNIFLRLVLFFFTLISVGAAAALVYVVLRPPEQTTGVFCLIFAVLCYAAAEAAVLLARLYRYGIEEALAVCSVVFLCAGIQGALFSAHYSPGLDSAHSLVPAAGVVFSLWIWRRFGFSYAFLAAMIFIVFLSGDWTSSPEAQRGIIIAFYATGLADVAMVRSRHRFDYLDKAYSVVEAFLWLGVYLAINLQLSSLSAHWWGSTPAASEFQRPFYWGTWVLIWCLPAIVMVRGVRRKDRHVMAVGAIVAILTLISNKPYLGWPRHTWDPMLLGILLTGVAIFVRRWLARGPGGIRHGFTAARLSAKDQHWMNIGATIVAPLAAHPITPDPQPSSSDFGFGGGQSGGGGASGDF
jgi:hypothetical protein